MFKPATPEAYDLLHRGTLALANVESNGIRVDTEYLNQALLDIDDKIVRTEQKLKRDDVWKKWSRKFGDRAGLGKQQQLATIIFDDMEHPSLFKTAGGAHKTDEAAFEHVDLPFVRRYFKWKKLQKIRTTYLNGIKRETCDGFLYNFFHLHLVKTYRSCIAKGTLIEVVRDVSKCPKGIPIEDVKAGQFVYCYDDDRNLTIKKVLWAGKTGRKKVIRLHWSARGKKGYLDLTPEHRVRMASGEYVRADRLEGRDYRTEEDNPHKPKLQVLSMGRCGDSIFQTNGPQLLDHRLVYETLVGSLEHNRIVHHKDGNHLNNLPRNLKKGTKSWHGKHHAPQHLTQERQEKGRETRRKRMEEDPDRYKGRTGILSPAWNPITRIEFLKLLSHNGGTIKHAGHAFGFMKRRAEEFNIDLKAVKDRYDRDGNYISKGRLAAALSRGRSEAQKEFGINYYKLLRMMEQRKIPVPKRRWANQFGHFVAHNHKITKVEYLNRWEDVYDIEVEDCHNFIANEICVHNSSSLINFQNIPVRDPIAGELIRRCFIPRDEDRVLVEIDFSGIEVRIAACYCKDPTLLKYIKDKTKDMHRDMAAQCYKCKPEQVGKMSRYCAKNMFVFPEFYGSVAKQCAPNLWAACTKHKLDVDGTPMLEWLKSKGIHSLGDTELRSDKPLRKGTFVRHIKEVEEDFWGRRFKVYADWKRTWYQKYQHNGGFHTLTGFTIDSYLKRNDVINYPVQGSAFHCLLWSLIELNQYLVKNRMKSLIVGQIHDSIVADVHLDELDDYLEMAQWVMTQALVDHWKWINVPIEVEIEVTPPGKSWHEKKPLEVAA